jgi:hypothetical protein
MKAIPLGNFLALAQIFLCKNGIKFNLDFTNFAVLPGESDRATRGVGKPANAARHGHRREEMPHCFDVIRPNIIMGCNVHEKHAFRFQNTSPLEKCQRVSLRLLLSPLTASFSWTEQSKALTDQVALFWWLWPIVAKLQLLWGQLQLLWGQLQLLWGQLQLLWGPWQWDPYM